MSTPDHDGVGPRGSAPRAAFPAAPVPQVPPQMQPPAAPYNEAGGAAPVQGGQFQHQPPGYAMPGVNPAPFGVDHRGRPYSDRSKVAAGVLQILIAGGGRIYTRQYGLAVIQFLVMVLTLGFGHIWSLIDGIVILSGSSTDGQGRPLR